MADLGDLLLVLGMSIST